MKNINDKRLFGQDLLDKVEALENFSKRDIAIACGYSKPNVDGKEIVDFAGFYEALLTANETRITSTNNPVENTNERTIHISKNGEAIVHLPLTTPKEQHYWLNIEREKWDDYYPGIPLVISLTSEKLSENSGEMRNNQKIVLSQDGILLIKSTFFLRGNRYCLEFDEDIETEIDNLTFRLEPEPWNGLEASFKENLRLLTLPDESIRDLLTLCHDEQEDLFDPDQYNTFEENLASSLKQALSGVDTEEANSHFATYGLSNREGKILALENWNRQLLLKKAPEVKKVLNQAFGHID